MQRCRVPGSALLLGAVSLPLLAPSLVPGAGIDLPARAQRHRHQVLGLEINIYGFWGLLIANGLYALPQAVLIIGAALRTRGCAHLRGRRNAGTPGGGSSSTSRCPTSSSACSAPASSCSRSRSPISATPRPSAATYAILATEIYNQVVGQMNFNHGRGGRHLLLLADRAGFLSRARRLAAPVRLDQRFRHPDPPAFDAKARHAADARRLDHR